MCFNRSLRRPALEETLVRELLGRMAPLELDELREDGAGRGDELTCCVREDDDRLGAGVCTTVVRRLPRPWE